MDKKKMNVSYFYFDLMMQLCTFLILNILFSTLPHRLI